MSGTESGAATGESRRGSRIVLVSGVAEGVSETAVQEALETFGEVASVRLNDGEPTVAFKSAEAAAAAIAASGSVKIGGAAVSLSVASVGRRRGAKTQRRTQRPSRAAVERDLENWVVVKPVMRKTQQADIEKEMGEYGDVASVDLRLGIAFVEFSTAEGARNAIAGSGTKRFGSNPAIVEARKPLEAGAGARGAKNAKAGGAAAGDAAPRTRRSVTQRDLYVSGFDPDLSNEDVSAAINAAVSGVESVRRQRGRGYAFVRVATDADAEAAVGSTFKVGDGDATVERRNATQRKPRAAPTAAAAAAAGPKAKAKPADGDARPARRRRTAPGKPEPSADGASIVVMNLPFQISQEDVVQIFKPFGAIEAIVTSAYSAVAHAIFEDRDGAAAAIAAGSVKIAGKDATVLARGGRGPHGSNVVYIRAISENATADDIQAAMASFGPVKSVSHRPATARAFIDYATSAVADSVIAGAPDMDVGAGKVRVERARLAARDIINQREKEQTTAGAIINPGARVDIINP